MNIVCSEVGHRFSFHTVYYYFSIFKCGKEHPQYYTARNFLRHVYGHTFVDIEYHENLEEFMNSVSKFYEELWAEDDEEPEEIVEAPVEKMFDSTEILAKWVEQHPDRNMYSLKELAKEFMEEDNICVMDSLPTVLPKTTITTAVSNDEEEIIGNNREARRKREIKKNRHKEKRNWRRNYYGW